MESPIEVIENNAVLNHHSTVLTFVCAILSESSSRKFLLKTTVSNFTFLVFIFFS